MNMKRILVAGYLGALLASTVMTPVTAEVLRVLQGQASGALNVPMNRAVVVESDVPFAELSIANPGIADISTLSDRSIYVLGKAPGRTTLTLLSPEGALISNVDVHVTPDIAEFKERLQQILPGEPIEVRTANDGIVLSGQVSSTAKLDRALDLANRYAPDRVSNLMVVGGTQQVMLKVRFAEMSRTVSKGFSSSVALGDGGRLRGESGTYLQGANGLGLPITVSGNPNGAIGLGGSIGGLEFEVLLEALESKGMVRTLAEPNLTALSGQEAKFLAGGEYPVPGESDSGGITVSYKPFGVELNFTPVVVDQDIINLTIDAAVSSIDTTNGFTQSDGTVIPAFRQRQTSTTVEMRDGESFAIAGLLQDDFRNGASQIPWIGDIPILGALFRSSDYQRAQTELVVIITPHLVTPVAGEALALPTDRVRIPTERDLFLFGKVATGPKSGGAGEVARQDFSSSYGYVME
ncbi:type II and III secretion system protein family protein [Tabrizicola sp.]|uniref:type II and III secretion system protein family protein n=1 Tax=Tabrizicola sp. TaxID=2005166 RepID=UPI00262A51B1|nr:type II and III secretion system protein family protein [Tabrizicola sp.]MDM7932854.1 type II and III secretion system protein family protein [Tabrizicola sp.]